MKEKIIKEGLRRAIPSARVLVEDMLKRKKKKVSKKKKEKIIKEVQDAKNFKNESIREDMKRFDYDFDDYKGDYVPDIEKKIQKKYDISFKKGGKIPKAGLYKLHKGEVVVPAHRVKTVDKALRKDGKKPLKKVCKNCVLTKKQLTARRVSSTRARR